jgi:hypothetical protein
MHLLRRRLANAGLAEPLLSLRMYRTYVLPTLSYGAEIWGPQLVLQGQSACSKAQLEYLRALLGVRDSTPALTLLAETGQRPVHAHWAAQIARFVDHLMGLDPDRIAFQALQDSIDLAANTDTRLVLAKQPWAAQVKRVLSEVGVPCPWEGPEGTRIGDLSEALLERHIASYATASVKVQRYMEVVWGGSIPVDGYMPAAYLQEIPERRRRLRLAQLRTGSSWLREETGRWERLARDQRPCPHCAAPLEDADHMVYDCPLYADLRVSGSKQPSAPAGSDTAPPPPLTSSSLPPATFAMAPQRQQAFAAMAAAAVSRLD